MNKLRYVLTAWIAGLTAQVAVPAASETALDAYLADMKTWSADFRQTMQDSRSRKEVAAGSGRLIIVRPGQFRWEKTPEGSTEMLELMVNDACNLWSLDVDLDQATVKPSKDLTQSPAMLLAGGADLRTAFRVEAAPRRDSLDWTRVQARDAQSDFREALFGFKGKELVRLVVVDKLGQSSTLLFANVRRNAVVDPQLMRFKAPDGVNVIGKPVQCRL